MAAPNRFSSIPQIDEMEILQQQGFISGLQHRATRRNHIWTFRINDIEIKTATLQIRKDFSDYEIKMRYNRKEAPRVFIESLKKKYQFIPHLHKDKSLCLYKPANWQWKNSMSFGAELFPTACLWLYYLELWLETGEWYGEEASH